MMCFGQAPFFIFPNFKNKIKIASNDDFVSFEILKVIEEIFKVPITLRQLQLILKI